MLDDRIHHIVAGDTLPVWFAVVLPTVAAVPLGDIESQAEGLLLAFLVQFLAALDEVVLGTIEDDMFFFRIRLVLLGDLCQFFVRGVGGDVVLGALVEILAGIPACPLSLRQVCYLGEQFSECRSAIIAQSSATVMAVADPAEEFLCLIALQVRLQGILIRPAVEIPDDDPPVTEYVRVAVLVLLDLLDRCCAPFGVDPDGGWRVGVGVLPLLVQVRRGVDAVNCDFHGTDPRDNKTHYCPAVSRGSPERRQRKESLRAAVGGSVFRFS